MLGKDTDAANISTNENIKFKLFLLNKWSLIYLAILLKFKMAIVIKDFLAAYQQSERIINTGKLKI